MKDTDYSQEIGIFVEKGILTSPEVISILGPGGQQGDSILVKEFLGEFTTRIYHLRVRYFTEFLEPSTYMTATVEGRNDHLGFLVPFAWRRDNESTAKLLFGLISKGTYPNGEIYQPNYKYTFGSVLNLGVPTRTMEFWYPKRPIPLSELKGLKLGRALFRSVGSIPHSLRSLQEWEELVIQHSNNTDLEQSLSPEAQMSILNAVSVFGS